MVKINKLYTIEYEGNIFGVYTDYNILLKFILGCLQNKLLFENVTIKTFNYNSCYCTDTTVITNANLKDNKDYYDNHKLELDKAYLIQYNNKILGLYDNYDLALDFIAGCLYNNFINNDIIIKKYYVNSCYCISEHIITKDYFKFKEKKDIEKQISSTTKYNSEELDNIAKQKIELQHNINLLKFQKKSIEESKILYENDYKLYKLFTENKQKDSTFLIPEIFIEKFDLMTKLDKDDNLSWNSFMNEYQHKNLYNQYFNSNNYEDQFIDNNFDINEEFNL